MGRQWPFPKNQIRITSRFAGRINPVTGRAETHSGTDFAAPDGTPFYAVAGGTVQFIGKASGYGQWIVVDHPASEGGGCAEYGHMWNAFATGLKVGSKVKAGQLLGYVGSNGQSTGPHLHLTIWQYAYRGNRVDPETWLANSPYPPVGGGSASATPPAPAPSTGGQVGTIYGIDVSDHQNGLPLAMAKAEGYKFCFIKATEGHTYRAKYFRSHLDDARKNGLVVAAYLYVWWNSTPAQMADAFALHVGDNSIPCILDIEENSGTNPEHWKALIWELNARGYHVPMIYIPKWYWERVGKPSLAGLPPLWSSAYPAGGGIGSAVYQKAGGDNGPGWAGYGGLNVAMWQFTEKASLGGGKWAVDGNAYKGTPEQLQAFLTGKANNNDTDKDMDMTPEQERKLNEVYDVVIDMRDQMAGPREPDGKQLWRGWNQLGFRTIVDGLGAIGTFFGIKGFKDTRGAIEPPKHQE